MAKTVYQISEELWMRTLDSGTLAFMDVYMDDEGSYAIYNQEGQLLRGVISLDENDQVTVGALTPVKAQFSPTGTTRQRPITRVQADGTVSYVRIAGTAVLNRSGELDSTALFDSLIESFDPDQDYPLAFYHDTSLRIGRVLGLARQGYVLLEYGVVDDPSTNILAQRTLESWRSDTAKWGASISFYPSELVRERIEGIEIPIYTAGTFIESSVVLADEAAHYHTGNSTFTS